MSYGGSNPPWQRSSLGAAGQQNAMTTLQSQLMNPNLVGYPTNQNMYGQNMGMAQQQNSVATGNLSLMQPMGGNMNPMNPNLYTQTVQYPNTRGPNAGGYGQNNTGQHPQQSQQAQQYGHQSAPNSVSQTCSRVGIVTKLQKDYGFVDDEILFHKHLCKGIQPKIGDRVVVEANHTNSAPFKWNATALQILGPAMNHQINPVPTGRPQPHSGNSNNRDRNGSGTGYKAVPPPVS